MFKVNDSYGNLIFCFSHDRIIDQWDEIIGVIRNGIVCDKGGTPTRCSIRGNDVMFPDPQTGLESVDLSVQGANIMDDGAVGAVVVGATNHTEMMPAAAAYWEFVWSQT